MKDDAKRYGSQFHLTERETEVLQLLVNRVVSPAQLGKEMSISLHTVNNHLKKIMEKTKCESKTALLADFVVYLDQNRKGLPPPRVLLVDDEPELTNLLQAFLLGQQMDCITASDPAQALDLLKKHRIDVVITDIRMPKDNGLSLVRELRKLHLYEPGVIFVSGFIDEYGVDSLFDLGAFSIMEKPVNLEKLKRLIWEHVIGKAQEEDSDFQAMEEGSIDQFPTQEVNLGYGGVFIPCKEQLPEAATLGKKLKLDFKVPGSEKVHHGVCEVAWTRSDSVPGFGARFLSLSPSSRKDLWDYVRRNNICSFIPKGISHSGI
jgi:DNA-binding NarL/FixJ family response regulator